MLSSIVETAESAKLQIKEQEFSLLGLPLETQIDIMAWLDYRAILSFQKTCRQLRELQKNFGHNCYFLKNGRVEMMRATTDTPGQVVIEVDLINNNIGTDQDQKIMKRNFKLAQRTSALEIYHLTLNYAQAFAWLKDRTCYDWVVHLEEPEIEHVMRIFRKHPFKVESIVTNVLPAQVINRIIRIIKPENFCPLGEGITAEFLNQIRAWLRGEYEMKELDYFSLFELPEFDWRSMLLGLKIISFEGMINGQLISASCISRHESERILFGFHKDGGVIMQYNKLSENNLL